MLKRIRHSFTMPNCEICGTSFTAEFGRGEGAQRKHDYCSSDCRILIYRYMPRIKQIDHAIKTGDFKGIGTLSIKKIEELGYTITISGESKYDL